jgi:hypothetical protein
MSIIRSRRPEKNFTIVDNQIIRNQKLSRAARALLIEILSYPDDWQTNSFNLARAGKEGRDAIRKMLKELETEGYLRRVKAQDERGRWSTKTYVFDTPQALDEPVDIVWAITKPDYSPKTDNQASETQALLQELSNKDYVKKSETFFETHVAICGKCDGQGYAGVSLDFCQVCEGAGLI